MAAMAAFLLDQDRLERAQSFLVPEMLQRFLVAGKGFLRYGSWKLFRGDENGV